MVFSGLASPSGDHGGMVAAAAADGAICALACAGACGAGLAASDADAGGFAVREGLDVAEDGESKRVCAPLDGTEGAVTSIGAADLLSRGLKRRCGAVEKDDGAEHFGTQSLYDLTEEKFLLGEKDEYGGAYTVNTLMRRRRGAANAAAAGLLAASQAAGTPVSRSDVEGVLLSWGFGRNARRANVCPDGKTWVRSDSLGLIQTRDGKVEATWASVENPAVVVLLNQYMEQRLPVACRNAFAWSSIALNCDFAARPHRDAYNQGPSVLAGFGGYSGGEVGYYCEDDGSGHIAALPAEKRRYFDIQSHVILINGNCAHFVLPFAGPRISAVWYLHRGYAQAPQPVAEQLVGLGFRLPGPATAALLRQPSGYGRRATLYCTLPPFRCWPTDCALFDNEEETDVAVAGAVPSASCSAASFVY